MLNLFEAHGMPITCYAVGQALEKNPAVVSALQDGKHEVASHAYRWIDYHPMDPGTEKTYIKRQLESVKQLTGEYPGGWYYGRLSPRSRALVWEVYKEMGVKLAWESDTYCDDLPYWVDVPAEKDEAKPEGMLMIPYTYVASKLSLPLRIEPDFLPGTTTTTSNTIVQRAHSHPNPSSTTSNRHSMSYWRRDTLDRQR